jgi:hypothetical protein
MSKKKKLKREFRVTKKTIYEVDVFRLDEFIEVELGFNPESIACWEIGNDSTKTLEVTKKLNKFEEEDLKLLLEDGERYGEKVRDSYSCPWLCMVELCRRELIPEGDYNVEVCW